MLHSVNGKVFAPVSYLLSEEERVTKFFLKFRDSSDIVQGMNGRRGFVSKTACNPGSTDSISLVAYVKR